MYSFDISSLSYLLLLYYTSLEATQTSLGFPGILYPFLPMTLASLVFPL